jgi:methionyl aminopeptidase
VPSPTDVLQEGDIINVDVTTCLNGFHGDTSFTFSIGEVSPEARHLVDVAQRCLWAGIKAVRADARMGDIGAAIVELAAREGCCVVSEYGGHGIGRRMHAEPHVSHVGRRGEGMRLKAGMAITIEPMICLGKNVLRTLDDGWTVVTADGKWSAQFEHTVLVTESGCDVMTLL